MSNEMKKNAILVWYDSDGNFYNELVMPHYEAYKLMKLKAVTNWMVNEKMIPINLEEPEKYVFENYDIEKFINCPGILVSSYVAVVFNNQEDVYNYKIIII